MKFKRTTDIDSIYKLYTEGEEKPTDPEEWSPNVQDQAEGSARDDILPRGISPEGSRKAPSATEYTGGRPNVDPKMLQFFIKKYYYRLLRDGKQESTIIYGEPGIGKTQVVEAVAKEIANTEGRTFVTDEKIDTPGNPTTEEILESPDNYWLLIDKSTGDMSEEEVAGFPSPFDEGDYTKTKPMEWTKFMVTEGLHGIIFLDEIGHAQEAVQRVLFRMINNRKLGKYPLSTGMSIHAATNLPDSISAGSGSSEILSPLINRFNTVQLIPDPLRWGQWARSNGVHPLVVMYANYDPERTFYMDPEKMSPQERAEFSDSKPFPTPRTIAKFGQSMTDDMYLLDIVMNNQGQEPSPEDARRIAENPLISAVMTSSGSVDNNRLWTLIMHEAGQKCGQEWAQGFDSYVTNYLAIKWDEYLKDPSKIASVDAYTFTGLAVYISTEMARAWNKHAVDNNIDLTKRALKEAHFDGKPLKVPELDSILAMLANTDTDRRMITFVSAANNNSNSTKFFVQYADYGDYDRDLKTLWIGEEHVDDKSPTPLGGMVGELRKLKIDMKGAGAIKK